MTEDSRAGVSSSDQSTFPNGNNDVSSQTKPRKKRKWDQPAESLVSACMAVPGLGNMASLGGLVVPGVAPLSTSHLINPLAVNCASIPQVTLAPSMQLHAAAAVVPKLKIQDELIAREIVINDAESSVRYKLTKRQTQEEIQKCTGAVVITRGKYRPPSAPPDGEKPLYLHISAGAHLKEMAERILAVDRAAAMVEEILKQGQNSQSASSHTMHDGAKVSQATSTCVFLGFDADPSFDIASRICGPNDQYINHIMNETGVTVTLRGCGSGNIEGPNGEGGQEPLHLFLSSNNPKKLEDARLLAENLMDTISKECGLSRVSSCKVYSAVPPPQQVYGVVPNKQPVYSAVPPPQQLLDGVHGSGNELNTIPAFSLTSSMVGLTAAPAVPSVIQGVAPVISHGPVLHSGGLLNPLLSQSNVVNYPRPLVSSGTSYNGYGGIYPQATPLQQVALALRQSTSTVTSVVAPTTSTSSKPKSRACSNTQEKRPPQKRKFQELPTGLKESAAIHQGSKFLNSSEQSRDMGVRNVSTMPAPKKLVQSSSNGIMPPPPPKTMLPPPPPPKFTSSAPIVKALDKKTSLKTAKSDTVPDTLVKLMEYGEEDDDDDPEESDEEARSSNSVAVASRKPFWAL